MRFSMALTTTACLLWGVSGAQAQYPGQGQPTLLPLPNAGAPSVQAPYARGYAQPPVRLAPPNAAWNPAPPTQATNSAFAPPPMQTSSQNYAAPNTGFAAPGNGGGYGSASTYAGSNDRFAPAGQSNLSLSSSPFANAETAHLWDDEPARETVSTPPENNPLLQSEPLPDPASSVLGPYEGPAPPSMGPGFTLPWGAAVQPGLWFGSLAGLIMTRDHANPLVTTYSLTNVNSSLLNTQQATGNWTGGGQAMFGRWFGPTATTGVQAVYWQLAPLQSTAGVTDPTNNLATPINLGGVNLGGFGANAFFDNAQQHQIWRTDNFLNIEINGLLRTAVYNPWQRLYFTGFGGARYFRFSDNLLFGSANFGTTFGQAGGADEAFLSTRVINNLLGFQLGTRADYFLTRRWRIYAMPMLGVFGNRVFLQEQLYTGNGIQGFNVTARKTTTSILGQIDFGTGWQITPRFSAFIAYRVVAVSRVALADNQIPPFLADTAGMQNIKTNGDLLLHGAVIGGMYNF